MRVAETAVDLLIIGGGCSAVALVAALRKRGYQGSMRIAEKEPVVGLGVAYATEIEEHILNVVAAVMGIYEENPADLLQWAERSGKAIGADEFVSRRLYGEYLQAVLAECFPAGLQKAVWSTEVLDCQQSEQGYRCLGADGATVVAQKIVYAIGHTGQHLPVKKIHGEADARLVLNPWVESGYNDLHAIKKIGILGTGLTAMDVVGALDKRGYRGQIVMISRRGFIPYAATAPRTEDFANTEFKAEVPGIMPLRQLISWTRGQIRRAESSGGNWRSVIDAFRDQAPNIWRNFSSDDKGRFLRHLKPYWEVARHRMPNQVYDRVADLRKSGSLRIVKGRAEQLRFLANGISVAVTQRAKNEDVLVDRLFNCTGSAALTKERLPKILRTLSDQGLVSIDRFGLGIQTTPVGQMLSINSSPVSGLYVVGPMRRSSDWESTAVREIRRQSAVLACELAK